jgi:hypothetical protein
MAIYRSTDLLVQSVDPITEVETTAPAFSYGAYVVDNGGVYEGAYVATDFETVRVGGMVRVTEPKAVDSVILTLSSAISPVNYETIQIKVNGVAVAAEIQSNGNIVTKSAIGDNGIITLTGITFLHKNAFADEVIEDGQLEGEFDENAADEIDESLRLELQYGKVSVVADVADQIKMVRVTFPEPFTELPVVTATAQTSVPGSTVKGVGAGGITLDGFDLYVLRTNLTSTPISWIAVSRKPAETV